MKFPDARHATAAVALATTASLLDVAYYGNAALHATLVGATTLAAAAAAYWVTRRDDLLVLAAATAAPWRATHEASTATLLAAILLTAILVRTPYAKLPNAALAAAAAAGATALHAGMQPAPLIVAAAVALAATLLRPRHPTQDAIGALRALALTLPALLLAAALVLNASSRRYEDLAALDAELFGLGLLGLAILASLAVLGLTALLESNDPAQRHAWTALAAALAVAAAVLLDTNPDASLRSTQTLVPLASALATLPAARLKARLPGHGALAYALPVTASLLQLGFAP